MIRTIWLISFLAAAVGCVTMNIPSKLALVLTRILFVITAFGAIVLATLLFSGGFIYD